MKKEREKEEKRASGGRWESEGVGGKGSVRGKLQENFFFFF